MKSWYVIHTKPRKEALAAENLQRQDFETYLPWIKRISKRGARWVDVVEPLFPRYLFARLDPGSQSVAPIRSTLGVTTLVTFGGQIRAVPDQVIEVLRHSEHAQDGVRIVAQRAFGKGDLVNVASGPFEGLKGVFEATTGRERVAVLLDILGKATTVVMRRTDIVLADR